MADGQTLATYLDEHPDTSALLDALRTEVAELGPTQEVLSKSQVAFRRDQRTVVTAWAPGQYLRRGAPLVLTFDFDEQDPSPRWKEVVEAHPGHVTHHLELHGPEDLDDEVRAWLRRAWVAEVRPTPPPDRRP